MLAVSFTDAIEKFYVGFKGLADRRPKKFAMGSNRQSLEMCEIALNILSSLAGVPIASNDFGIAYTARKRENDIKKYMPSRVQAQLYYKAKVESGEFPPLPRKFKFGASGYVELNP